MSETLQAKRTPEKRSLSPLFWLPFGAGGMLFALFGPGLVLSTGILGPTGMGLPGYHQALAFAHNPIGKLIVLAVIALAFWHGAERVFLTLKDMKVGPIHDLKWGTYGVAAVVTAATVILLLVIEL